MGEQFAWLPAEHLLVKVATTIDNLSVLDQALHAAHAPRRYAVGGNVAWIAWPDAAEECHQLLTQIHKPGLIVRGDALHAQVGASLQNTFLDRVRAALDPADRFLDFV